MPISTNSIKRETKSSETDIDQCKYKQNVMKRNKSSHLDVEIYQLQQIVTKWKQKVTKQKQKVMKQKQKVTKQNKK